MHTPTPHLASAAAPGGGLLQTGFHMGRVVAVHDDSDTVDVALHQGGLLRNVVVLSQLAGRKAGHVQLPPVTAGNGTATPTGENDTYAIIGYLQGKTLMPLVFGYLSPRDHALINRPVGASVRRDVGGQVSIAYPDGATEYVHGGGRLRLGETLESPDLDSSLVPASDNPLQASFVNSVGVNINITGDTLNVTAPGGMNINGTSANNHAALQNLDFDTSGHVGFASEEHAHDDYALADHSHESGDSYIGASVDSESEFTSDLPGEQGQLRVALDTSRLWICRVSGDERTWEPVGYLQQGDLPTDEVDDHIAPDPPFGIISSWEPWDGSQRSPDLTLEWQAPERPDDWYGYDLELRTLDQTVIRSASIPGDATMYHWSLAVNHQDGWYSEIIAALRSRDKWGNVSDWVQIETEYPLPAAPGAAPQLSSAFRTIQATFVPAGIAAAGVEVEFDRSLSGLTSMQLSPGSSSATCNAQTGETILVRYRYLDHYGRPTDWGPADSLIPAMGEIQRFDLASLEQEIITSNNGSHTAAQIAALRDGQGSVDACAFAAGDRLTFDWPMARKVLGIILYASGAATPEWSLVYTDVDGNVLTLAANSNSDHTVAGTDRNWLLRSYDGEVLDSYVAEALPVVGGMAYREWHFGDSAVAASRVPKAITAQNLTLVFNAAVTLSEIRVLTYEAAQLLFARKLYLSEGAQIVNDDSDTGFIIDTANIQGLNNGVEVGKISASDGSLWWKRGGFGGTSATPKVALTDNGLLAGTVGAARVELTDTGLTSYNGSNVQTIDLDSATGDLTAGPVKLNQDGIQIEFGDSPGASARFVKWGTSNQHHLGFYQSGSTIFAMFQNHIVATGKFAQVISHIDDTADNVNLDMLVRARSTGLGPPPLVGISISQYPTGGNNGKVTILGGPLEMTTPFTSTNNISALSGTFTGGLNVGSSTGAATGEVKASGNATIAGNVAAAGNVSGVHGTMTGGLNVGSATGAATGEVKASGNVSATGNVSAGGNIAATGNVSGVHGTMTGGLNVGSSTGAATGEVKASGNATIGGNVAATGNVSGAIGSFTGAVSVGTTSGGLNVGTTGATAGQVKTSGNIIGGGTVSGTSGTFTGGLNVGAATGAGTGEIKAASLTTSAGISVGGAASITGSLAAGNLTAVPGASKIVQAEASGRIHKDWLPALDAWTAPTFTNSWANLGVANRNTAGYFKDASGIVHLRGVISSGAIGTSAFTLPSGYRPQNGEVRPVVTNNGTTDVFGRVTIDSNGNVIPAVGGGTWTSLDGLQFRAV